MRALFILVSLCIASITYAESQKGGKTDQKPDHTCGDSCRRQIAPTSGPITINVSPSQTLNASPEKKEGHESEKPEWEMYTGIGTVFLAVATLGLALVALGQRYDAADTAKKQLRAYLGIKLAAVRAVGDGRWQAFIIVENTGNTPAYEVRRSLEVALGPRDGVPQVSLKKDGRNMEGFEEPKLFGRMPLAPRATWETRQILWGLAEADRLQVGVIGGTKDVFVWGRIEYLDIYKKKHFVTFRFVPRELGPDSWALHPMEQGNDAS